MRVLHRHDLNGLFAVLLGLLSASAGHGNIIPAVNGIPPLQTINLDLVVTSDVSSQSECVAPAACYHGPFSGGSAYQRDFIR